MTIPGDAGLELPPFQENRALLLDGLEAPLPLSKNPRSLIQEIFRRVLRHGGALEELVEPAATAGGGLIHACQELIHAGNRLVSVPKEELADSVRSILWACKDFLGAQDSSYALKQAAETMPGPRNEERRFEATTHRNLLGSLERRFEELGLPVSMDAVRFAVLQVQLDEVYDKTSHQLQSFYGLLARLDLVPGFRDFSRRIVTVMVKEVIPDQILGVGAGPGKEKMGLMDLLPEFEREFI